MLPPFLDLLSDLLNLEYSLQTGQKTGQIYANLLVRISELAAPRALILRSRSLKHLNIIYTQFLYAKLVLILFTQRLKTCLIAILSSIH